MTRLLTPRQRLLLAADIAIASALIWVGYQLWGTNVR